MNKQGKNGIEWTNYTWNVIGGCKHACEWEMPDGTIAECYAKTVAERVAQSAYPNGFEHHYWHPTRLAEPLKVKEPSRIFLDSMSDLMGHWVSDDQINQVLDVCRQADWHTFQLLTKNAPRLHEFDFPENVWVGVSAPPSFMFGRRLTMEQQIAIINVQMKSLQKSNARIKWMSVEPLSFDIADYLDTSALNWIVIGAASRGRQYYQPKPEWVTRLLAKMDSANIPVFFKGNLAWNPVRRNYPNGDEE